MNQTEPNIRNPKEREAACYRTVLLWIRGVFFCRHRRGGKKVYLERIGEAVHNLPGAIKELQEDMGELFALELARFVLSPSVA